MQQLFYNEFNKIFVVLEDGHAHEGVWSKRSV